jgi:hypothetical protein
MSPRPTITARLETLEHLLAYSLQRPVAGPPPPELYNPAEDRPITAAYFLLDPSPDESAESFILQVLHRLVQQLSRSTVRHEIEYRGQVRGRIVWPATYKTRLVQGGDSSLYVCHEVRSRYDTPENQLLQFMLAAFGECLRILPETIREGACYRPVGQGEAVLPNGLRLNRMESALHSIQRNVRLLEITRPAEIGAFHLQRAEAAQLPEYARLAELYRRYQCLVLKPSWSHLVHTPGNFILLPDRAGGSAECWIRLGARLVQARQQEGR